MSGTCCPILRLLTAALVTVSVLSCPAFSRAQTPSLPLQIIVSDPPVDNTGLIDVSEMTLQFDGVSGAYEIRLRANDSAPFVGSFRVNVNLFNVDANSYFQDVANDYTLSAPTTTLTLTGNSVALQSWTAGTRVFTNSLFGTANPAGTSLYRTSVTELSGFLTNEDYVAFADPTAPAMVTRVSDPIQPPMGLTAWSITGNQVTVRWTAPTVGLTPTSYLLEGGVIPGEVLASIPVASEYPVFTFTAPSGAFYVRMHSTSGLDRSAASNEIRLFVNTPAPPSAPASLVAVVSGSSLALAWRNTFAGGPAASLLLEVNGTVTTSVRLAPTESLTFASVPSGTYSLALRAENGSGVSSRSNSVTLAIPAVCTGPPMVPANFLAYRVGATVHVTWQPAAAGPAPTAYQLSVSGSLTTSVVTTTTSLRGTVGPGVYALSVAATNMCGASPATSIETVTVP
jgi:hypothetical protein